MDARSNGTVTTTSITQILQSHLNTTADTLSGALPSSTAPFVCVNILPPHQSDPLALQKFQEQIMAAKEASFTHIWINPITAVKNRTACYRTDLDTGLPAILFNSLYAPDSLLEIRPDFPMGKVREIVHKARINGVNILVDFVWKHINKESKDARNGKLPVSKIVNDIIEYDFEFKAGKPTKNAEKVIQHLKKAIDLYLHPTTGYGFSGLRIDAASHITPPIRKELYQYIRQQYPNAIIFEECLFDRAQVMNIANLAGDAVTQGIFSDFVTSNLYYQKPDVFGALPHPSMMGDRVKLQLANGNGISFTGNHDHYSVGWNIILSMAAQRLIEDKDFIEKISTICSGPSKNDVLKRDVLIEELKKIAEGTVSPASLEYENQKCIRYLLPYANEIARKLLTQEHEHPEYRALFNRFRFALFERISNLTMPSISGYFFLFSELTSPFETQRIFSNVSGKPLPLLLLTVDDLKQNLELTRKIITKIGTCKKYDNLTNFNKYCALPNPDDKKKNKQGNKKKKGKQAGKDNTDNDKSPEEIKLDNSLRIWLPVIIEYLRNYPEDCLYTTHPTTDELKQSSLALSSQLGTVEFVKSINQLYAKLTTFKCADYHTFSTIDCHIVIRCNQDSTDVIILNLDPTKTISVNDIDLEKIALWLQSRIYPQQNVCQTTNILAAPFTQTDKSLAPDNYAPAWKKIAGPAFDHCYTRVVGCSEGHQTNLFLGPSITLDLNQYANKIVIGGHIKTTRQLDFESFEGRRDKPLVVITKSEQEQKVSSQPAVSSPASSTQLGLFGDKLAEPKQPGLAAVNKSAEPQQTTNVETPSSGKTLTS
ncbi:MAG: hypothetical protein KIT56_06405 [Gammaproteobacteria bacterium]|nr:hypothetical protein [Gammaproteobacteria bacterium]MCW5583496.1 hypothetical protein [Gammaproteobacteria bacterium]